MCFSKLVYTKSVPDIILNLNNKLKYGTARKYSAGINITQIAFLLWFREVSLSCDSALSRYFPFRRRRGDRDFVRRIGLSLSVSTGNGLPPLRLLDWTRIFSEPRLIVFMSNNCIMTHKLSGILLDYYYYYFFNWTFLVTLRSGLFDFFWVRV